jgi:small subunit ribosomal protein S35
VVDASIHNCSSDHRELSLALMRRIVLIIEMEDTSMPCARTDANPDDFWMFKTPIDFTYYYIQATSTTTTMATPLRQACRKAPRPLSQWTSRAFSTTKPTCASSSSQLTPDPEVLPSINLESLPSQAHADIETHREIRALARKAAWEMPLLGSLSKPFTPPTQATPLRWRYTTYMGEVHPASKKVVVEFAPADLPDLNEKQKLKLIKLAGARWSPAKETVRMSCESFESQAQNKRFLGETIAKLLAEARDPNADSFEDVPLDLRHVENKRMQRKQKALHRARLGNPNTGFPVEWRMTEERRAELEAMRNAQIEAPAVEQVAAEGAEGEAKVEATTEAKRVVSGLDAIEEARKIDLSKVEEPLMAEARAPIAAGKQGKKQFGQTARK